MFIFNSNFGLILLTLLTLTFFLTCLVFFLCLLSLTQPFWVAFAFAYVCPALLALSCFRLLILLTTAYLGLFLLLLLLFAVTAYMLAYYWLYITSCCLPLSTFAHFHYIPYSILYFICVYSYVFHHTPCIIDCNFHGLLNLLNFRFLSQVLTGVGFQFSLVLVFPIGFRPLFLFLVWHSGLSYSLFDSSFHHSSFTSDFCHLLSLFNHNNQYAKQEI